MFTAFITYLLTGAGIIGFFLVVIRWQARKKAARDKHREYLKAMGKIEAAPLKRARRETYFRMGLKLWAVSAGMLYGVSGLITVLAGGGGNLLFFLAELALVVSFPPSYVISFFKAGRIESQVMGGGLTQIIARTEFVEKSLTLSQTDHGTAVLRSADELK